jgi:hypothetical protein
MKRLRVGPFLVALLPIACGLNGPLPDGPILEAFSTNIRLCGFPASQLVEDHVGGGHIGRLYVGQRLPLRLRGETDRINSVSWSVNPQSAPQPPVVRLTGTGRFTAVLEAVAAGGDSRRDFVFVGAGLVFKDASEGGVNPSACDGGGGWVPANRIFVVER